MSAATSDPSRYVNPFSGTAPGGPDFGTGGGAANTFPGAVVPFGMVQWSPDTAQQQPGGYYHPDNRIRGFSLTHFSGAGCDAAQDIPFLPALGPVRTSPATDPSRYLARFTHANEVAEPGYYSVTLDSGIAMELTAAQRSGRARICYPPGSAPTMLVNVAGSVRGVTAAQVDIGPDSISGWADSGDFCGAGNAYRVYFSATFDRPFTSIGIWHDGSVNPGAATARSGPAAPDSGRGCGAFVSFDPGDTDPVEVRVGLSYVSVASAVANARADQGESTFDAVRAAARTAWQARLNQIQVTGGTAEQLTVFYTELYHSLLHPNVFSDHDGRYIGFDGELHQAPDGHPQYANFSGWDIYRSQVQLLALLAPAEAADIAQSMFNQARQSGDVWDRWSANNDFTGVMVGDPYHSIIASVYAFGATGFDAAGALASMVRGATTSQPGTARYVERPGLADYQTLGYVPGDPSTTLEYTVADFGIAQLAERLGEDAVHQRFMVRAQYWHNLFNPVNGYLQPRDRDGSFPPFDPASPTRYIEGNGAQYTWMVPHNPRGLFNAMGGDRPVVDRLDTFFTELNAGPKRPYAYLGNEPNLNAPWLYAYAGAPYRTQEVVRRALSTLWRPDPAGFVGNNDLGTMSAWYVWAALGLFPQAPGRAELIVGSPLFPHIVVHRPTGQTITIDAPAASAGNRYVTHLTVDGAATTRAWLPESFVATGGTLAFTLTSEPDPGWGSAPGDAPPSFRDGEVAFHTAVDPSEVRVELGGPAGTAHLVVGTIVDSPAEVAWAIDAPAGVMVTPAAGTIAVPAIGPARAAVSLAAGSGVPPGFHDVPVTLVHRDGATVPGTALTIRAARSGSLLWHFDNTGVSDNAATTEAALDRGGYSYSAQSLAGAGVTPGGRVSAGGFTFTWPDDPVGRPDNVVAAGQRIDLSPGPEPATRLAFLGCGTNGDAAGDATITYTDGTTQPARIGFGDWVTGGRELIGLRFGNVVAARMVHRNASSGTEPAITYLFGTAPIPLRSGRTVASVTLPTAVTGGDLHIFALATA